LEITNSQNMLKLLLQSLFVISPPNRKVVAHKVTIDSIIWFVIVVMCVGSMEMRLFWTSLQLGALPNGDQGESKVGTLVCHFWNFSFPKNTKNLWQNILVLNLFTQKLQPNKSLGKWPMTISWFTLWNWSIHWSFLPPRAWIKNVGWANSRL
jgi:hypothetical protein